MLRISIVLASALLAWPALAQEPTAAQIAAAKAEGDALLAAAGAQDFFVNETGAGSGAILLRHKPSGYRCVLNPGKSVNRVALYPHPRPGHNVGCTSQTISDSRTFYITHAPEPEVTEQLALDVAMAGIRQRFPGARPAPPARSGAPTLLPPPGLTLPEARIGVVRTGEGDERIDVGKRGEWLIKYRYSAPAGIGAEGGPLDMFWPMAVLEGERHRAAAPAAAPAATQAPPRSPALLEAAAPRPLAEQRADAAQILRATNAPDLFRPVEEDGMVSLRHTASGLTCPLPRDAAGVLINPNGRRGDDVACYAQDPTGLPTTTRARRRAGRVNLDRVLADAVGEVRRESPRLQPASGPGLAARFSARPGARPVPEHRTTSLEGLVNGRPAYVRVSAAILGDWIVTQTSFSPAGDRVQADLIGEIGFGAVLLRMMEPAS